MPTVSLWQNSDYTGQVLTLSTMIWIADLSTQSPNLANAVSSVSWDLLAQDSVLTLFDGTTYGGSCVSVRMPDRVHNLGVFGFNDKAQSLKLESASGIPGVTLCEDTNCDTDKSSYAVGYANNWANYTQIWNVNGCNNIGNDELSTVIVMPHTRVYLYKDSNFGGGAPLIFENTGAVAYQYYNMPAGWGDEVSSLKVQYI